MEMYAHIIAVGIANGTHDRKIEEYQITLNAGGAAWVKVLEGDGELATFLETGLAVKPDLVERAMTELHEQGQTLIPDIELKEVEGPALGLRKTPIDF
ncbi:MAG TPA: hypothetical protein VKW78_01970 [Terriglobales bacterium]|nr:hypothetical protein [Terriglobales bacterium]